MPIEFKNDCATLTIGSDGKGLHFVDNRTGADYAEGAPFAKVRKAGREYPATAASLSHGKLTLQFGDSGVGAALKITPRKRHFEVEVLSVTDEGADEFTFVYMPLKLKGELEERFVACALALNLQTNVLELPGASSILRAMCYPRFGFAGAKVALIGCPTPEMRQVMQEVVSEADELPHSSLGGPWALDSEMARGSYLFNFENLTEQTADDWIRLARSLGMTQIDFHGGSSFRFGDIEPNPTFYPNGLASLKAVVDKLHAGGIKAGLHTYAFFLDKNCRWVTPVPDPRLGSDMVFTLDSDLSADETMLPVVEPTRDMSTITGFFVRNSVTLRIDQELITFSGISKEPPYAFTGCQRGALGTKAAAHARGAKVYHLKECFGRFVPDGDSTLFTEVAARTAEVFNTCGFDMMYMDALDAEDIFAGTENGWHYGSKFVFEVAKRVKKPALMEMSTFHHHLWYVRSRMGAWDHPTRGHKQFIDNHVATNENNRRMYLPSHLGWWNILTWDGAQREPTSPDVMEYLCCKALGTDTGFSLLVLNPEMMKGSAFLQRIAGITRRYEALRHSGRVPEEVKARLRAPGAEFTLVEQGESHGKLVPIQYARHKAEGHDVWRVNNRFGKQQAKLRIEMLLSAVPYDAPGSVTLADFASPGQFAEQHANRGVKLGFRIVPSPVKIGSASAEFTAENTGAQPKAAWAMVGRRFEPTLDVAAQQAMGVWVYGDGQGEVLNLQVKSPEHITGGYGEHYIPIDFTGWRYFELIEPEAERYADYSWPYRNPHLEWGTTTEDADAAMHWVSGAYHIYRESVDYSHLESLSLWLNDVPSGKRATVYLGPIRALPLVKARVMDPSVTINGKTITFPGEFESGCTLEFASLSDCKLYGPDGNLIREIQPTGEAPILQPGGNTVRFASGIQGAQTPRAYVSVISQGEPIWQY